MKQREMSFVLLRGREKEEMRTTSFFTAPRCFPLISIQFHVGITPRESERMLVTYISTEEESEVLGLPNQKLDLTAY